MKGSKTILLFFLSSVLAFNLYAQEPFRSTDLEKYAYYFSLGEDFSIDEKGADVLNRLIGDAQFVGLAEIHQSQQLSFFTVGLLDLLSKKGFKHLALEIGPMSAKILDNLSCQPNETLYHLKSLNQKYGRSNTYQKPIFFVDKQEDAKFIAKASELDYAFWGLDQEYDFSYVMHFDEIYKRTVKSPNLESKYREAYHILNNNIFKNTIERQTRNCWFKTSTVLKDFLDEASSNNTSIAKYKKHLEYSWDIYCKQEIGSSGQYRANYMKALFNSYYKSALLNDESPKVLFKLGGVHLTHGRSYFNIDDIGKQISDKAKELNTEFISIRHIARFKNGKDLMGRKDWKSLSTFQQMGKKDKWTIIDLRPLKEKLKKNTIGPTKAEAWEIKNYDIILIPPNDRNGTSNI